jgi:uncharacterized ferritin-like protein (DUF455 family)
VPRTLEARGLDAAPPMQTRLEQAGDRRAVAILDVILRDEARHVAIWKSACTPIAARAPASTTAMLVRLRSPSRPPGRSSGTA